MAKLNMRKLNKIYRSSAKSASTVHGVSLQDKMRRVHEMAGVELPRKKADRISSTLKLLSSFSTCGKIKGEPASPVQKRTEKPRAKRDRPDKFYASWDWKKARYEALRIHGHRCQCCGWRPGDTDRGFLVVDHIKPRSKFPKLELDVGNMQVLCNDCNMGKSNVWEDDFRKSEDWFSRIIDE